MDVSRPVVLGSSLAAPTSEAPGTPRLLLLLLPPTLLLPVSPLLVLHPTAWPPTATPLNYGTTLATHPTHRPIPSHPTTTRTEAATT